MTDPQNYPHSNSPHFEEPPTWGAAAFPDTSSTWAQPSPSPHDSTPEVSGVIPFRPLSIADLFSGTINAIRTRPAFHLGLTAGTMTIVGLATGLQVAHWSRSVRSFEHISRMIDTADPSSTLQSLGAFPIPSVPLSLLVLLVSFFASAFLTGMLALAVSDSVIGRRPRVRDTWNRLKTRFLPLLGTTLLISMIAGALATLSILIVLVAFSALFALAPHGHSDVVFAFLALAGVGFLVIVVAGIASIILALRLSFAPIVCVLEERGPAESLSRSWALTRGVFWRLLGRYALMCLMLYTLTGVVAGIFGALTSASLLFLSSAVFDGLSTALTVICAGLAIPVQVAYMVLMYTDERMRREGFAPLLAAWKDNLSTHSSSQSL